MTENDFDQEWIRFVMKYSDDASLASGFHMDAAGWIGWVRHVLEMDGRRVSNVEALHRLEKILDDRLRNPFRSAVRARWEDRIIEIKLDRVEGPGFLKKLGEALTRLRDLIKTNGANLTPAEMQVIEGQFRVRVLEMVAIQMALGNGQYHVNDAAARAFRKMWADNEWGLQEKLPVPIRAWMPVFQLEET
jgi:hypothetical protein